MYSLYTIHRLFFPSFAYVDFATLDAKTVAIAMSENHLEGRRLLIKDGEHPERARFVYRRSNVAVGDDFNGRPAPTPAAGADGALPGFKITGHTKTAQKILAMQKQPPGPTLFLGNLGFETTEDSIRELLNSHRAKDASVDEKWIRKVRLGTFEDSGKCKGCVLSIITSALRVPVPSRVASFGASRSRRVQPEARRRLPPFGR